MGIINADEISSIISNDGIIQNCSDEQICLITHLVENFLIKIIKEVKNNCILRNGSKITFDDFKKVIESKNYFFLKDIKKSGNL